MHFDDGEVHRLQRIKQRNRGMGIGPGIDDDPGGGPPRFLDPIDQYALVVRLAKIQRAAKLFGGPGSNKANIFQRIGAVDFRFARAEQIKIRPIENQDQGGGQTVYLNKLRQTPRYTMPGVRRKKALLNRFGSAKGVSRATMADLQTVEGVNEALARRIYDFFHGG